MQKVTYRAVVGLSGDYKVASRNAGLVLVVFRCQFKAAICFRICEGCHSCAMESSLSLWAAGTPFQQPNCPPLPLLALWGGWVGVLGCTPAGPLIAACEFPK